MDLRLTSSANAAQVNQPVKFTAVVAGQSSAPLVYSWDFGDGTFDAGHSQITHAWATGNRDYAVCAYATDLWDRSASQTRVITIGHPVTARLLGAVVAHGLGLQGAHINVSPGDAPAGELLHNLREPFNQDWAFTDSSGHFVLVGIEPGLYLIRPIMPGYYILPIKLQCPLSQPLIFHAVKTDLISPSHPTAELHIHARIDGRDELWITHERASWKHFENNWPHDIEINGIPMRPRAGLANFGKTSFLAADVRLDSAVIASKSGRGLIDMYQQDNALVVNFDDPQAGAADYDLTIQFDPAIP